MPLFNSFVFLPLIPFSSASRLKRSPGKLSAADALSLLAILDSRDPYSAAAGGPLSEYGPNDVLPYSPSSSMAMANQATQDIPLSLALAQLLAERNSLGGGGGGGGPLLSPYGDLGNGDDDGGDGQWMNSWTEPGVDYMGFPMDVGAGRLNGGYGIGKPSKIGEFGLGGSRLLTLYCCSSEKKAIIDNLL